MFVETRGVVLFAFLQRERIWRKQLADSRGKMPIVNMIKTFLVTKMNFVCMHELFLSFIAAFHHIFEIEWGVTRLNKKWERHKHEKKSRITCLLIFFLHLKNGRSLHEIRTARVRIRKFHFAAFFVEFGRFSRLHLQSCPHVHHRSRSSWR